MCLSALHRYNKDTSGEMRLMLRPSLTTQNTFTHMHTEHPADLSSPFLPEFGGPGGLSVTDPVEKKEIHNMYNTKI